MLLALDENNHQQTGASESQINSLPQSVIQVDMSCYAAYTQQIICEKETHFDIVWNISNLHAEW